MTIGTIAAIYAVGFFVTNIFTSIVFKKLGPLHEHKHPGCIPGLTWPLFWPWLAVMFLRGKIKGARK